jgi:hypothetical protein
MDLKKNHFHLGLYSLLFIANTPVFQMAFANDSELVYRFIHM